MDQLLIVGKLKGLSDLFDVRDDRWEGEDAPFGMVLAQRIWLGIVPAIDIVAVNISKIAALLPAQRSALLPGFPARLRPATVRPRLLIKFPQMRALFFCYHSVYHLEDIFAFL